MSGQDFESDQQGGLGAAATNVVQLPRPWYGSPAELVPIGAEPSGRDDPPAVLTHARDFWGGESAGLERVSGPSPAERPAGRTAAPPYPGRELKRRGEQQSLAADADGAGCVEAWIDAAAGSPVGGAAGPAPRLAAVVSVRRLRRLETVVLALAALAAGAAAAVVLGAGLASPRTGRAGATRPRSFTVTETIPVREPVVRTVTSSTAAGSTRLAGRRAGSRRLPPLRSGARGAQTPREGSSGAAATPGSGDPQAALAVAPGRTPEPVLPSSDAARSATVVAPSREGSGCAPSVTNGGACSL